MSNILIFGNSGSGKSTLAKSICKSQGLAHLDLDSLAWKATTPPERRSLNTSKMEIDNFIQENDSWVIEGCYTDLLELAESYSNEVIFMNLPIEDCISNAKSRPWEPHKYESKQAQDENLGMLIDWISQYTKRDDTFSMSAHQKFYNDYSGKKRTINSNVKCV
ncbi:shikimate kinase [Vibrio pectenicida]|uniref:Shikimate kinase n=1 Tax=Vibrio pectenicida TaxID=62763 RepID=A0A7Y4A2H4_9VIBR|nr:AAA family ATPase [Vibrio pectenicida]NOH72939.1 shikimate kinase [Vibrio pectenicida]